MDAAWSERRRRRAPLCRAHLVECAARRYRLIRLADFVEPALHGPLASRVLLRGVSSGQQPVTGPFSPARRSARDKCVPRCLRGSVFGRQLKIGFGISVVAY